MSMTITAYDNDGRRIADLGTRATMAGARQAMLDHAGVVDLPDEEPLFLPDIGVLEGWFIGRVEYLIRNVSDRSSHS